MQHSSRCGHNRLRGRRGCHDSLVSSAATSAAADHRTAAAATCHCLSSVHQSHTHSTRDSRARTRQTVAATQQTTCDGTDCARHITISQHIPFHQPTILTQSQSISVHPSFEPHSSIRRARPSRPSCGHVVGSVVCAHMGQILTTSSKAHSNLLLSAVLCFSAFCCQLRSAVVSTTARAACCPGWLPASSSATTLRRLATTAVCAVWSISCRGTSASAAFHTAS